MKFLPRSATNRLEHSNYVLLAGCSVTVLSAWQSLSLWCKTIKNESALYTRQMKFQKWCIEKWSDSFPGSYCVVLVPDLHQHYQFPLFSRGNHLCLWAILLAVLTLLQRSVRVGIEHPPWVFYCCLFYIFHLAIWLQQGRMDEEVQGLLLQILRMSQQGQWGRQISLSLSTPPNPSQAGNTNTAASWVSCSEANLSWSEFRQSNVVNADNR